MVTQTSSGDPLRVKAKLRPPFLVSPRNGLGMDRLLPVHRHLGRRVSSCFALTNRSSAMPKAKVLIVNDDAYGAMEMQQLLTLVDFDVVGVAASLNDALCLAENTHPDLAIFD